MLGRRSLAERAFIWTSFLGQLRILRSWLVKPNRRSTTIDDGWNRFAGLSSRGACQRPLLVYPHHDLKTAVRSRLTLLEELEVAKIMSAAVANRLQVITQRGGITSREVAQLLDTTPETVSRWNSGKVGPRPESLERILALEFLLDELSEFYTSDEARLWLFSPHKLLERERPADRIQQGRLNDVLALIDQLRDGAYA